MSECRRCDPRPVTWEESAELRRARRRTGHDPRSIKLAMRMSELRGKTPEMVRREVWAHVLAYNLIRTVMAQAAARYDIPPRSISFTGVAANVGGVPAAAGAGGRAGRRRPAGPVQGVARGDRHLLGRRSVRAG